MKYIGYIYLITNTLNNKQYVGQHKTSNINDGYMGFGHVLHKAYDKYGKDNFTKSILFYTRSNSKTNLKIILDALEKYYIRKYNTFSKGYNLTLGGDGLLGYTPWNKGKTGIQKAWNKGIPCSDITKQKISESKKGKPSWNKGIPFSEETKKKMRKPKIKLKWLTPEGEIVEMSPANAKCHHPDWKLL